MRCRLMPPNGESQAVLPAIREKCECIAVLATTVISIMEAVDIFIFSSKLCNCLVYLLNKQTGSFCILLLCIAKFILLSLHPRHNVCGFIIPFLRWFCRLTGRQAEPLFCSSEVNCNAVSLPGPEMPPR